MLVPDVAEEPVPLIVSPPDVPPVEDGLPGLVEVPPMVPVGSLGEPVDDEPIVPVPVSVEPPVVDEPLVDCAMAPTLTPKVTATVTIAIASFMIIPSIKPK